MELATDYTKRDSLDLLDVLISSLARHIEIEELETDYLRSIASLIPAHATAIYIFKPTDLQPVHITASGVDEDFLSYYESRGREVDPLRQWITANRQPNQSQLLFGLEGWQLHPVYRIVGTAEIDFAMQSPILFGSDIIGTLNFGRQLSEGAFTRSDLKAISIISHFLGLAISNIFGCSKYKNWQEHFCKAISNIRQGMVIAGDEKTIRYANTMAQNIASRAFGENQAVEQLARMLQEERQQHSFISGGEEKQLTIRQYPIPGSRLPNTLVLLDESGAASVHSRLKGVLTRREIDVYKLVEKGKQNQDIANELCISINTVKRHLDNIYCKMNVNSRAELIAKVYRSTYSHTRD